MLCKAHKQPIIYVTRPAIHGELRSMAGTMDPLALLMLARDNKVAQIEAAVALGVPPDTGNGMGQTALHIAALWGNYEAAEKLLDLGADVNVQNARGQTPLHFAASARKQAKKICEMLISRGASKDLEDASGRKPYELADDDDVRKLLGGPDGRLFEFAGSGKVQELQELLKSGAVQSVRVMDSRGRTALNIAVTEKHKDAAKVLLDFDPGCLNLPDSAGDTALHCAVDVGDKDILGFLLDMKPNLNAQNMNPSEYAAGNWVLKGETIMPLDKSPLHLAVEGQEVECAELLLKAGADVNLLDFDKRSALHLALEQQDEDLINLIVAAGGNVNQANPDFVSPLHFAAQRGSAAIISLFLKEGANVHMTNDDGWTPLHLSARVGNAGKVGMLLAAGASVSAVNSQGNTPLHLASINGHAVACKLLIEAGADKTARNKDGKSPVDVAKNPDTAAVLTA